MEEQYGKEDSAALRVHRICQDMEKAIPTRAQVENLITALDAFLQEIGRDPPLDGY